MFPTFPCTSPWWNWQVYASILLQSLDTNWVWLLESSLFDMKIYERREEARVANNYTYHTRWEDNNTQCWTLNLHGTIIKKLIIYKILYKLGSSACWLSYEQTYKNDSLLWYLAPCYIYTFYLVQYFYEE